MSATERLADWHPARFIEMVATRAAAYAWQAGVGGMETAGGLISYLAKHPEDIEPFINGGIFELPENWPLMGQLSQHAAESGSVVSADEAKEKIADPYLAAARKFGEQAIMARLPRAPTEKREALRQRVASIRAGILDNAPEVQSAYLALTHKVNA